MTDLFNMQVSISGKETQQYLHQKFYNVGTQIYHLLMAYIMHSTLRDSNPTCSLTITK